jgi:UDP-2,3-diacylglucosamine pyrophosphatase LpxH
MAIQIPVEVKKVCCQMKAEGRSNKEIYDTYFLPETNSPASENSFRSMLNRWQHKQWADDTTLKCGTYEGFIAHDATVQVTKDGEIIQAWIKQKASDIDPGEFIAAVKESVEPFDYEHSDYSCCKHQGEPSDHLNVTRMLEIPLFDMHWGVAFMDYYKPVLSQLLRLVNSKEWNKIVIPFGQDFFHNDSIVNGQTTKGTVIEKVDMTRAVKEAKTFIYALIDTAIHQANEVKVIYTPGNHDRSISWMFMQVLLERYGPSVVDDTLDYRKVISYGKNSIMITHGDSKQATAKNLAHIFPITFAEEFANADVREVHAGHLHHEAEADIYGVMVRRLSSGGKVDDWSNKEDFVGTHRRFMVFEWDQYKLASIHYI